MALALRHPAIEAASVDGALGPTELDPGLEEELRDDLVQESLLRVLEACPRFPDRNLPAAFTAAIARNVLRSGAASSAAGQRFR